MDDAGAGGVPHAYRPLSLCLAPDRRGRTRRVGQTVARIDVVVPPGRPARWQDEHRAGKVPGRWPYGLHHLAQGDEDGAAEADVHLRVVPPPSRLRRLASGLPRSPLSGPAARVGLAWDENLAPRMVATRDYDEMHCGVIWATDRWATSPSEVRTSTRKALARMSSVWTLSRPQLEAFDGLVPDRVRRHFVKFGVDSDFYDYVPYPDRPLVFSVGGDRDRDTETLLAAFDTVRRARPGVRLVLQTHRDVAPPEGVEVVDYLPHVELRAMYAAASVVAVATHPNLHVSGMTVSLEAQSVGRPVVLTRTPGTADYVEDGETGFLTPVGDAGRLADHIISILDDPDAGAALGSRGRAAIERDLTDRHLAARLRRAITS